MSKRDFQRLAALDEEIISLRISYERERNHELMINKHTLLQSRGIKFKLEQAMRARKALVKLVSVAPTARSNFNAELKQRQLKIADASEELDQLLAHLAGCMATNRTNETPDSKLALAEASFEVKRQRIRIAALERSMLAYSKRGEVIPERATRSKAERAQVQVDIETLSADAPVVESKSNTIENSALAADPKWNTNPYDNPIYKELLKRPEAKNVGGWGDDYTPPPQQTRITI